MLLKVRFCCGFDTFRAYHLIPLQAQCFRANADRFGLLWQTNAAEQSLKTRIGGQFR
jgi:hypothetical protein